MKEYKLNTVWNKLWFIEKAILRYSDDDDLKEQIKQVKRTSELLGYLQHEMGHTNRKIWRTLDNIKKKDAFSETSWDKDQSNDPNRGVTYMGVQEMEGVSIFQVLVSEELGMEVGELLNRISDIVKDKQDRLADTYIKESLESQLPHFEKRLENIFNLKIKTIYRRAEKNKIKWLD